MGGGRPGVRIWCENLAVMEGSHRRPLSALAADSHVHGGLRLEIGGRLVPHLGYWGPDDVCLGQWLGELRQAARELTRPGGRHFFDEGEQGQPAFVFERDGDLGLFRIIASELSGADGDSDWQRVEFVPAEFVAAYHEFRDSFAVTLRSASPHGAEAWLVRFGAGDESV